jgi:hypothetical protein
MFKDGLTWGIIQCYDTQLGQAIQFSERTNVRLVFALLGPHRVHEAVRWTFAELPDEVVVMTGNRHDFGKFPLLEWGKQVENKTGYT